jgi:hypothetical protein
MYARRYDEYIERHEDDDIHKEEIEWHQSFTVSDRGGLTKLDTGDAELLEEESCPSKKHHWKSKHLLERHERLDAPVVEVDSDVDDFLYVNYLMLL